jgi:hypothetical protein
LEITLGFSYGKVEALFSHQFTAITELEGLSLQGRIRCLAVIDRVSIANDVAEIFCLIGDGCDIGIGGYIRECIINCVSELTAV